MPTIRELCKLTGRSSSATIHSYLEKLKRSGYIEYEKGKSRTIRLLNK